jgi:hypothetical protein
VLAESDKTAREVKMINIEITRHRETVEIQLGTSNLMFMSEDYDTLFHAMREVPARDVVWQSLVTEDAVTDLSDSDKSNLINELNDYVANSCTEYGAY